MRLVHHHVFCRRGGDGGCDAPHASYFIAWQNPALRPCYGQPGEPVASLASTAAPLRREPGLFAFQAVRALLWTLFALPVIRGSRVHPGWTALLVGRC